MGSCARCGVQEQLPYACRYCGLLHCTEHRMPENHGCAGLDASKAVWRERGYIVRPAPEEPVRVRVRGPGAGARVDSFLAWLGRPFNGSLAISFLAIMVGTFFVQVVGAAANLPVTEMLALHRGSLATNPWAVVTSIFAHGGFSHLFVNALFMVFFGPTLERILGPRRFAALFIGSGMAAGLGEVFLSELTAPSSDPHLVVGASGALMALFGALSVMAPHVKVWFMFFLPVPIWVLAILYALGDLTGAISPVSDGIAHYAHLTGLAIGALAGYQWRREGILRRPPEPEAPFGGRRAFYYRGPAR